MSLDLIADGLDEDRRRVEFAVSDAGRYWRDELYERFLREQFSPMAGGVERYRDVLAAAAERTKEALRRLDASR